MFKLHIEFNTGSLILSFNDGERVEDVCHIITRSQKFVYVYSDADNMWHYINTDNILYFYVVKIKLDENSDGGISNE